MEDVKRQDSYVTPVNIAMVAINVVVYFVLEIMGNTQDAMFMFFHGAMHPAAVLGGQWYRLLTSAYVHFGLPHLLNNMILLIGVGSYVERALGKVRYLILYLTCAAGSSVVSMIYMLKSENLAVSGGASGVVFGVIGALLFLVIRHRGRMADLTLRRVVIMIALSLYFGFTTVGVDNAAHVGGLLIGFLLGAIFWLLEKGVLWIKKKF